MKIQTITLKHLLVAGAISVCSIPLGWAATTCASGAPLVYLSGYGYVCGECTGQCLANIQAAQAAAALQACKDKNPKCINWGSWEHASGGVCLEKTTNYGGPCLGQ